MSGLRVIVEDSKVASFLQRIPPAVRPIAIEEAAKYFVGNDSRGLKHYPPPKPSRYVRTYLLKSGWAYSVSGESALVANPVKYAGYVQGNPPTAVMQARGWRGYLDVIASNITGALRSAQQAVNRYLKGL